MLYKIITGLLISLVIVFIGITFVLAQDSTTTTSSDFELRVEPSSVKLTLGQSADFNLTAYYTSGDSHPVQREEAQWTALSTAGILTSPGVFQASNNPGVYNQAIRVGFNGQTAYIKVIIDDKSAHNTTSTTDPTPTPTSITATSQSTTNSTNTPTLAATTQKTTNTSHNFILKIDPKQADIYPNQRLSFSLHAYYDSGVDQPIAASEATWYINPTTGIFLKPGVFKSASTPGDYDKAIRASFNGQTVYATLRIKPTVTSGISANNTPTPTTATDHNSGSSPTSTPIPTPTPLSTQAQIEIKNSLILDCLKSRLQPEEYFRYFDPAGSRESLDKLSTQSRQRAQRCFQETKPTSTPSITQTVTATVAKAPSIVDYNEAANDPLADECLQLQLTAEQFQQIRSGRHNLTPEQLKLARRCYQLNQQKTNQPLQIRTDSTRTSCLKQTLGSQRYQQIYVLHQSPTDTDKHAVSQCFVASQNQTDPTIIKAILPPDPAEVPFIPTDQQIALNAVTASTPSDPQQQGSNAALTLSGTALPNSLVDLYIFSDPIVVSTETDANGDWYYQLAYHLPEGDHHAYTVVSHPDKGQVRSEVIGFNIAYAQADDGTTPQLLVSQSTLSQSQFRWYFWSSLGLIIFAVGLTLVFFWYRAGSTETVIHAETIIAETSLPPAPDIPPPPTPKM